MIDLWYAKKSEKVPCKLTYIGEKDMQSHYPNECM